MEVTDIEHKRIENKIIVVMNTIGLVRMGSIEKEGMKFTVYCLLKLYRIWCC